MERVRGEHTAFGEDAGVTPNWGGTSTHPPLGGNHTRHSNPHTNPHNASHRALR